MDLESDFIRCVNKFIPFALSFVGFMHYKLYSHFQKLLWTCILGYLLSSSKIFLKVLFQIAI